MTIVLKHQLEASERSAAEIEGVIERDRQNERARREVEYLMRVITLLHRGINRDIEIWQDSGASTTEEDASAEWLGLHHRLNGVFQKVVRFVHELENDGQEFQRKQEFLASWRDLRSSLCFTADRVSAAVEQVRRGEVRPLGEVARELWDRPI
jgi:hypothetical protein